MKRAEIIFLYLLLFLTSMAGQELMINQDTVSGNRNGIWTNALSEFKTNQLEITEMDIIKKIDSLPAFSIYKDNFIITGISLNHRIGSENADAKYQISFRQRLTTSRLPFNSFLYLTYTQKSFWNIYMKSSPFRDNNYNPGIGLGRYIISDNKLKGAIFMQIEHESNGQDGEDSRDFNFISLSGKYFINDNLLLRVSLNPPFYIGKWNSDIVDYRGLGYFTVDYRTHNNRWWFSGTYKPRKELFKANTILSGGYKVSKKFNQYIYAELYNGTGDSMLDYKRFDLKFRLGMCIKSDFYNAF